MVFLSSLCSFLAFGIMVFASLMKGQTMGKILAAVCIGNTVAGLGYLFAGGALGGAIANFYGAIIAIVNYIFDTYGKPLPKWLIATYALISIGLNIWTSGGLDIYAIIVIAAFFAYIFGITSRSGAMYRVWNVSNVSLWCVYDVITGSFGVLPAHLLQICFAVVGMIIHDRKKKVK